MNYTPGLRSVSQFIPSLWVSFWFINSLRDWKKRHINAAFGSRQVKRIAAKLNVQQYWQKQYFVTKLVLCHFYCFPHWTKLIVTKDFNVLISYSNYRFVFGLSDLFWIYFWVMLKFIRHVTWGCFQIWSIYLIRGLIFSQLAQVFKFVTVITKCQYVVSLT